MIEKEKGEAKSFRKNCHMATAEDKCGWTYTLGSYTEGVPSITGVATTEICRFSIPNSACKSILSISIYYCLGIELMGVKEVTYM